jgi:hypothetical protein
MSVVADFNAALDRAKRDRAAPQPACDGRPATFVDYNVPPTEKECRALCEPCPLLAICRASARAQGPEWGIRGGIAWQGGKQYHWLERFGLLPEGEAG